MTVTFDVNFWSLVGVLIALFSVLSGRAKASADQIHTLRTSQSETNARFGERLQAVETKVGDGVGHDDLEALRKANEALRKDNEEKLTLVHRRVDELHGMFAEIKGDLGEMKGILRAGLPPLRN